MIFERTIRPAEALFFRRNGGRGKAARNRVALSGDHAGQVIVADGTEAAACRLEGVLTSPGMGVVRHADAGYPAAIEFATAHAIRIPMQEVLQP